MKVIKTTLALIPLVLATSVHAATTHTMTDGRFDIVDAEGTLTASGHNNVLGAFDMVNGTGTLDEYTPFSGVTWHADIIDMSMHNTMLGGTDVAAVEAHTFEWTNRLYANSTFTNFVDCRISGAFTSGCDVVVAEGLNLLTSTVNSYSYNLHQYQFANHIFFDSSTNADIPILAIMQVTAFNADGSMDVVSVGANCDNGAGTLCGTAMATSPFPGQTPIFSGTLAAVSAVPVPAAIWLFGSGLIGLFGLAKRKRLN